VFEEPFTVLLIEEEEGRTSREVGKEGRTVRRKGWATSEEIKRCG
jgi:hypothetical protein